MLKFFRIPFATSGDKAAIPDTADVNGYVSYAEGYGFDYERQRTDPAVKNIERTKMNEVLFDITTGLSEIQSQGIPDFITPALNGGTAYSYAVNAIVRYSGALYRSLVAANTSDPTDATQWAPFPAFGNLSARDRGAVGDGVANDRSALVAADAVGAFVLERGTYLISSSVAFTNHVTFLPGAVLTIPTGVTVTFNGGISAPVAQIFACSGTGGVVFNWAKQNHGYAEWWGAISGSATAPVPANNTAAFNAALVALPLVEAMPADYFHDSTLIHMTPGVTFRGAGSRYDSVYGPRPTRLLLTSATGVCVRVGPATNPGTINQFPQGIRMSDIFVQRTIAPNAPAASPSVSVRYVLSAELRNVVASESIYSFHCIGTVSTKFTDCAAVRATAGTGGTDLWRGFYVDGITDVIAAGGNASIYLDRCSASCNVASLQTGNSSGFYLDGAFTDAFLTWPETVNCRTGINVIGNSAAGNTFSNTDLHIVHPIMDQFHYAGIFISNVAEAGSVVIDEPYCGPATDARASIWFSQCPGGGRVDGGQLVHGGAPAVQPIIIDTCSGVEIDGTQVLECGATYPAVGTGSINNCVVRPKLKNKSVTAAAGVQLAGTCTANIIEPVMMGKAGAFTLGVQVVGTADARNEYRCTGIDSACIGGGSANKLTRNGVQIVATGLSGSNLVAGVMT